MHAAYILGETLSLKKERGNENYTSYLLNYCVLPINFVDFSRNFRQSICEIIEYEINLVSNSALINEQKISL